MSAVNTNLRLNHIASWQKEAGLEQVPGLVLQMAEIRAVGKRAGCLWMIDRLATSFHRNARCPHIGLKEGGEDRMRPLREGDPVVR